MNKEIREYINIKIYVKERTNEQEFINAMIAILYSSDAYFKFNQITRLWRKSYRKLYSKYVYDMNYLQKQEYLIKYITKCFKKYSNK